jgi:O-antigen/teichoic acid export membrane protein
VIRSCHPAENFPAPDDTPDADAPLGRIVRNSAFNAMGTALIVPFNFLALFTLARRLGAEPFGTFFTIFAISAVIHWIADAGTTTVLTRRVARFPDDLRTIVAETLGVMVVVCAVSSLLFFSVAAPWMMLRSDRVSFTVLVVVAVAMWSRHALEFASNVLRGLERFEFENMSRVLQVVTFYLFVWVAVYPETGGALAAFVAYAASNVIAAGALWAVVLIKWHCVGFRLNWPMIRRWWSESVPLGFGDVIRQLHMQLDTLVLSVFASREVVGLFSMAARPRMPLEMLPRAIVSVTFPTMTRTAHTDRAAFSRMFAQTTALLWSAALPISIGVSICAAPLLAAAAGPSFLEAAWPLRLLIWATALIFVNAQLRLVLTALDAEQSYWRLIGIVLGVKLVLEAVMIPLWGMYGACAGSLLGEIVLCVGGMWTLRRLGVVGPAMLQLVRVLPASVAMAAVLWPLRGEDAELLSVAAGGIASGVVYVLICLATGVWPWSDVMRLWQAVRRPVTAKGFEPALLVHQELEASDIVVG